LKEVKAPRVRGHSAQVYPVLTWFLELCFKDVSRLLAVLQEV